MLYVTMTDKFMSNWGMAKDKINKFVVICENWEQAETIERNAHKRNEMKYININLHKPRYTDGYLVTFKNYDELGEIWKQ